MRRIVREGFKAPKPHIKSVLVFGNLNVAVLDEAGNQIPELQKNLANLWAYAAEEYGFLPAGCILETQWGDSWELFLTSEGRWNTRLVKKGTK